MASTINASTSAGGGIVQTADSSGVLGLQTAGTTAVTIDASQNVGIGTSSPASTAMLEISRATTLIPTATVTADAQVVGWRVRRTGGTYPREYYMGIRENSTAWDFYDNTADALRMRIDSSGKVVVGTTSAIDNAQLSAYSTGVAFGGQTTGTSDFFWVQANTGGTTSQSIYVMPFRFGSGNSFKGAIYYNGSTGLMEYQGTSDYRTKEDVVDAPNQLDAVSKIKVREFLVKGSTQRVIGFVAHELQEYVPIAVNGEKDAVDENDEPILQTVNQQALIPVLVKAIQEQQAIIEQLKADVEALKGVN